ncbi:MAG: tetratricopeptide repeat protein, partial [Sedimentisphaerales bacterium]|nr:tetratricopeptide repeat protein [Sedimentisphaerales bacterium]
METLKKITIIFLLAVGLAGSVALAKSASVLLQEGLYAEEVEGNLDTAIKVYQQVIDDPSASKPTVAQAMYRQGMCYLKQKDEQKAKAVFQKLVQQYADQTSLVEKVAPLLADLTNHDPATLMPPDTLAYIEMGNPGRQIETILQMLKGTPFENPLAVIGGGRGQGQAGPGGRSPGDIIQALLNPSMMAEFKKIRGMAVGVTAIQQNNPPFVAVLYPGKSDALRGLILAGLSIVGTAGEPIEGMQTLNIKNGPCVAHDDEVIIIAQPLERLSWCVKQYKGVTNEPTLASQNKVFAKLSKENRQANAITVWVDGARTYSAISGMLTRMGQAEQLRVVDGIADLKNVEDILATISIQQMGIAIDTNINFKDGHNCLPYKMIQTPNLSANGFKGVPPEAVAVASFAYGEAESGSTETAHKALERLTGLSIGREIYANIEQVNLFIMPSQGTSNVGGIIGQIVPCFGLTLTSREPQHTYKLLTQILEIANLLATAKGATQAIEQSDAAAGKYVLPLGRDQKIYFYIGQRDKITTLALSPEVLKASLSAVENNKSALAAGVLQEPFKQLTADTSKMVLVNVGGAIRMAGPVIIGPIENPDREKLQQALEQLAQACSRTTVELRTNEQVNNFVLHAGIANLPPVNQVFEPATQISKIISQARGQARTERQRAEAPAHVLKTSKAPVIDGTAEELWSAARQYKLGNVIYSPLSSADDCSADYRTMWDANNLYVLIDVTDDTLVNDTSPDQTVTLATGSTVQNAWWFDDCVEVYIDADNSKSSQYDDDDAQYHFDWDK